MTTSSVTTQVVRTSDLRASGSRISARRGSASAPDPFAHNARLESHRGISSRLTILCIPPTPVASARERPVEDATSFEKPRRRAHTTATLQNAGSNGEGRKERLSFAFSSFSHHKSETMPDSDHIAVSPPRSPIEALSQKHRSRSGSSLPIGGSQFRRASLTPHQVIDLARTSLDLPPRDINSEQSSLHVASGANPTVPTPFTPLPESHYLPFLDRPLEVDELLSNKSNARLMALLRETFPQHLRDSLSDTNEQDPRNWSFRTLSCFLRECPRSQVPDDVWVSKTRLCIKTRSEIVWERFKGVLGVPPELDDETFDEGEEGDGSQEDDLEDDIDDAWVEPIFPSSTPGSPGSPRLTASPYGNEDEGFKSRFGGRGSGMETIGEGEEVEDTSTSATTPRGPLTSADVEPTEPVEPIRALRLHTRLSFSGGRPSVSDYALEMGTGGSDTSSCGDSDRASSYLSLSRERSRSREATLRPELERGPGNPLFPSNFSRLSVGPTLRANNFAHRRSSTVGVPAYHTPALRRSTVDPPHRRRVDHLYATAVEYAITSTSESDLGSTPPLDRRHSHG
ncbi:hypothetical protein K439DRAFT_1613194 [Ramaria rubella]|nr:hypothetical protein K439DRAFT_1613194 [Ramaria rubella]